MGCYYICSFKKSVKRKPDHMVLTIMAFFLLFVSVQKAQGASGCYDIESYKDLGEPALVTKRSKSYFKNRELTEEAGNLKFQESIKLIDHQDNTEDAHAILKDSKTYWVSREHLLCSAKPITLGQLTKSQKPDKTGFKEGNQLYGKIFIVNPPRQLAFDPETKKIIGRETGAQITTPAVLKARMDPEIPCPDTESEICTPLFRQSNYFIYDTRKVGDDWYLLVARKSRLALASNDGFLSGWVRQDDVEIWPTYYGLRGKGGESSCAYIEESSASHSEASSQEFTPDNCIELPGDDEYWLGNPTHARLPIMEDPKLDTGSKTIRALMHYVEIDDGQGTVGFKASQTDRDWKGDRLGRWDRFDITFVIDATWSMRGVIDRIKEDFIQEMVNTLGKRDNQVFRFGYVIYRDENLHFADGKKAPVLEVQDPTTRCNESNYEDFGEQLKTIRVSNDKGSNDQHPEEMSQGIDAAITMLRSQCREHHHRKVMVVVGDAPSSGQKEVLQDMGEDLVGQANDDETIILPIFVRAPLDQAVLREYSDESAYENSHKAYLESAKTVLDAYRNTLLNVLSPIENDLVQSSGNIEKYRDRIVNWQYENESIFDLKRGRMLDLPGKIVSELERWSDDEFYNRVEQMVDVGQTLHNAIAQAASEIGNVPAIRQITTYVERCSGDRPEMCGKVPIEEKLAYVLVPYDDKKHSIDVSIAKDKLDELTFGLRNVVNKNEEGNSPEEKRRLVAGALVTLINKLLNDNPKYEDLRESGTPISPDEFATITKSFPKAVSSALLQYTHEDILDNSDSREDWVSNVELTEYLLPWLAESRKALNHIGTGRKIDDSTVTPYQDNDDFSDVQWSRITKIPRRGFKNHYGKLPGNQAFCRVPEHGSDEYWCWVPNEYMP